MENAFHTTRRQYHFDRSHTRWLPLKTRLGFDSAYLASFLLFWAKSLFNANELRPLACCVRQFSPTFQKKRKEKEKEKNAECQAIVQSSDKKTSFSVDVYHALSRLSECPSANVVGLRLRRAEKENKMAKGTKSCFSLRGLRMSFGKYSIRD